MSLETQLVALADQLGQDIGMLMASQQQEQATQRRIYTDADFAYAYRFPDEDVEEGLE